MAQSLVVTAALVVVNNPEGRQVYLYQGAPVPGWVTKEQIDNLDGMVGKPADLVEDAVEDPDEKPVAKKAAAASK